MHTIRFIPTRFEISVLLKSSLACFLGILGLLGVLNVLGVLCFLGFLLVEDITSRVG